MKETRMTLNFRECTLRLKKHFRLKELMESQLLNDWDVDVFGFERQKYDKVH